MARARPETTPGPLDEIYAPVRAKIEEVDRRFADELSAGDSSIAELLAHVSRYRGKRLRPALLLLSGKAAGNLNPAHIHLAMAVEAVHTATLVHDDVLDEATLRRHAPTVNRLWGNEASVLLGDYLFAAAFKYATRAENIEASRILSDSSAVVCEGELMQIEERGNFDLTEARYIEIVKKKTASLCAASCRLGVLCADGGEDAARSLFEYGESLGVAFQIVDDCLDLVGRESEAGKSLGTDLKKGKLTLPVISMLNRSSSREEILLLLRPKDGGLDVDAVRKSAEESGAIKHALAVAAQFIDSAKACLAADTGPEIRRSMSNLADYVVSSQRRPARAAPVGE